MAAVSLKPWPELLGRKKMRERRMRERRMRAGLIWSLIHLFSLRTREAAFLDITSERSDYFFQCDYLNPRASWWLTGHVVAYGIKKIWLFISQISRIIMVHTHSMYQRFHSFKYSNFESVFYFVLRFIMNPLMSSYRTILSCAFMRKTNG